MYDARVDMYYNENFCDVECKHLPYSHDSFGCGEPGCVCENSWVHTKGKDD